MSLNEQIARLHEASVIEASLFFLIANTIIVIVSVLLCWGLGCFFTRKRIFETWQPLKTIELCAVASSIILNAGISVLGWWLWQQHIIITHTTATIGQILIDSGVMIIAMDLGMYCFHRIAHYPKIYTILHRFHHRHETTNPISLFVLHPAEVIGFGMLMIVFLWAYSISIPGLIIYLTVNVLWGTLGHSGVEPFPAKLRRIPILNLIGTSTFHAEHHEHPKYNFGFYTLIWDKLFGTLDPEYDERFDQHSP